MGFDISKFERTNFVERTGELRFPGLQVFFDEDEDPIFKVRGLTAEEIYSAKHDANKGKVLTEIVGKLSGGKDREKAAAILEAMGMNDDAPAELIQIYSHLEQGLIEPKLTRPQVIRLARAFPIEVAQLNNLILELSGKGAIAEVKQ